MLLLDMQVTHLTVFMRIKATMQGVHEYFLAYQTLLYPTQRSLVQLPTITKTITYVFNRLFATVVLRARVSIRCAFAVWRLAIMSSLDYKFWLNTVQYMQKLLLFLILMPFVPQGDVHASSSSLVLRLCLPVMEPNVQRA